MLEDSARKTFARKAQKNENELVNQGSSVLFKTYPIYLSPFAI